MAEKVNKSNTSLHYHSLINLCALYLSCYLAQRRAEALQFMILPRHIRFISWGWSQIRYSSTSMTGGMCLRAKIEGNACLFIVFVILSYSL